jgi:phenylacetate-CoA ligase
VAEVVANISECELGSVRVDEDRACQIHTVNGRTYRLVGTNYSNSAAPLRDTRCMDLVTVKPDASCSCGRPARGGISRWLDRGLRFLGNGARVGRMDHVFKHMVNIKEAQIRQVRPGQMAACVVRGLNYSPRNEDACFRRPGSELQTKWTSRSP